MVKRIRLGLIFSVDEKWIGGTYYILNLISALHTLPDNVQPVITILSKNEIDLLTAQKTGYKYLNYKNPFNLKKNLAEKIINKTLRFLLKYDIIDKRISDKDIDLIFPAINDYSFSRIHNKIYWFPDFQHIHLPEFFSTDELRRREYLLKEIAASNMPLVLSSESAKRDWESLKLLTNCSIHTVSFAVTHPMFDDLNVNDLYKEFNIDKEYFIISNQFWKHKNHLLVLKAITALKKQNQHYQYVFTGREGDYDTREYFKTILDFIDQNELTDVVRFLGLIDRNKQLKLMKHAKAVIQPSLFEGWSTVIEDAKAIGKFIIASDIPVHREQLSSSCCFFDPYDERDLEKKIISFLSYKVAKPSINYHENILAFGKKFQSILHNSNKVLLS